MSIRIGIYGYGNLGRGVEYAIRQNPDMTAVGVFTRRDPKTVKTCTGIPVFSADDAIAMKDKIDVMILCGGSATDLPKQTPALVAHFNVVDSFDTHAKIPEHMTAVDAAARSAGKTAMISVGWDPGMFSLARLYGGAVFTEIIRAEFNMVNTPLSSSGECADGLYGLSCRRHRPFSHVRRAAGRAAFPHRAV